MTKKYPKIRVSKEAIEKTDNFMKSINLKFRTDALNIMNGMQPIILGEKSVRLAKSKEIIKYIDVRYAFKLKK